VTKRDLDKQGQRVDEEIRIVLALVKRLRERLVETLGKPLEATLFGSFARGEATEESDIDVMVAVPHLDKETLNLILDTSWEVGFEAGQMISVAPVSFDELEKLSESPFIQKVKQEGIDA